MTKKRRGLGNLGIDVLLSSVGDHAAGNLPQSPPSSPKGPAAEGIRSLGIDTVQRGRFQPRHHFGNEALEELAASIRAQGLLQPVVVREIPGGYELVAGERRWRAARIAGLDEIPAIVRSVPDQAAAAIALIENIQREDLNPLEEAGALKRLIDEFGLTHQEAADSVGRSRAAVSNILRLLELEHEARDLLDQGRIEMGHARALLALPAGRQAEAARRVAERGLSVRETEAWVKKLLDTSESEPRSHSRDPDVVRLENTLGDRLGARVDIRYNTRGKGSLVIHYNSLDELDGLLAHIN
ncbi:MAG: ParB/RepB/Spo0J family partition protein [Gammaproteobacteria bacterium]|jgi:ParB family chromosome partitioning protein|nr:ParB/RepB/Spo0J family partition protein [Gammaproteobacteria bacterium]